MVLLFPSHIHINLLPIITFIIKINVVSIPTAAAWSTPTTVTLIHRTGQVRVCVRWLLILGSDTSIWNTNNLPDAAADRSQQEIWNEKNRRWEQPGKRIQKNYSPSLWPCNRASNYITLLWLKLPSLLLASQCLLAFYLSDWVLILIWMKNLFGTCMLGTCPNGSVRAILMVRTEFSRGYGPRPWGHFFTNTKNLYGTPKTFYELHYVRNFPRIWTRGL